MSKDFFDGLSEEHQTIVREAIEEAEAKGFELARQQTAEAEQKLIEAGAEVNDVAPEVLEKLQETVVPVYEEFNDKLEPHLSALREAAAE